MRFFVTDRFGTPPSLDHYPFVVLKKDDWNDYSFYTLFHPVLWVTQGQRIDLRNVKIIKRGQEPGRTEIADEFHALDDTYCSLGQELAYYESLLTLPENVRNEYLTGLRDAAADSSIRESFEDEQGFKVSLLRWGSAELALEQAPALFLGDIERSQGLEFTFHTKFGSNEFATHFRYCAVPELPGRLNAIIGYNGTGKTQLLANLAFVARSDIEARGGAAARYGRLVPAEMRFGAVVAVSYSAFDTFDLPSNPGGAENFGYTYCGLRRYGGKDATPGLKDVHEIEKEIAGALLRINTQDRRDSLENALQPLRDEPSFKRAGYELDVLGDESSWREEFALLSTGHKISVNIIVQLVSALQQRSLVLIDEPESHLHPPLLAALMRGISIALETRLSYAVIATHSPVVLQEIAGCYAHVLRRHGTRNSVETPKIETFGENVGLLTRHVFNLDNRGSDYEGVLRDLASQFTLAEMDKLFEHGLSSQARTLVMQEMHD